MTHRTALLSAVVLATLMVAACGQKGPLYLPEEAETTASADSPAPDTDAAPPATEPSSGAPTPGE